MSTDERAFSPEGNTAQNTAGNSPENPPPPPTAARSSAIMAAGTLVSRILGFLKVIALGYALSATSALYDTFSAANNLPNLVYVMLAAGVFNAVLVPQIIRASKQPDGGVDFTSRLVTLIVLLLAGLTVLVTLGAGVLMHLTTQGWTDVQLNLGIAFALWCLPQIFFYGLYATLGQILNAHGRFGWYMWAPAVNNVVAIAGLVVFVLTMGRNGDATPHTVATWTPAQTVLLAGSSTLGVVCQALMLLWPLRRLRLGLRPRFGWRGIGLAATGRVAGWTILTMIVSNGVFLFATYPTASIASGAKRVGDNIAGQGVLDTASMIYTLPHAIVALSIATVLFNRMSAAASSGDVVAVRAALSRGLRTTAVATVFGGAALLVLAGPLGMLFAGGRPADGAIMGQTVVLLAVGAPFFSIAYLMGRVFYAEEDARTPFFIQCGLAVFGIAAAVGIQVAYHAGVLPASRLIFALALSYTVQNILAVVITHPLIKRRLEGDYDGARILDSHLKMSIAALVSALVGGALMHLAGGFTVGGFPWHNLLTASVTIAVTGLVMLGVYLLLLRVLRVRELGSFLDPILGRLRRR
ncbi:murein biosynthesis integral membrane protein MurJ [Tersicoccus sp. Bi-70]|uniref:murein biosynthesis integral membrane protein MurJ n=1 Tax=Tersicoccus sp. Bi-70 TaxID=1897634 RepID=UPI001E6052E2|nr:lipid II flippase MurJ [Tersicoccus sp. Bi-70]